jgi:hypothetical protein
MNTPKKYALCIGVGILVQFLCIRAAMQFGGSLAVTPIGCDHPLPTHFAGALQLPTWLY